VPTKVRILYPALHLEILFYRKLKNPFCKINIPTMIQIMLGTEKNIETTKIIPVKKSNQLPKSFNNPIKDFIKNTAPKKIRTKGGINFNPNMRINPPIKSIAPNIFINIFFKLIIHLKI
jgi:hypothetical protein